MPVVAAAFAAISSFVTAAAATWIGSFIIQAAIAVGLSLLARALAPKTPKIQQSGIQTTVTTSGGTIPQKFVVGTYATSGHLVAPPYSHTGDSGTPNGYLTYIVEVSDVPGVALSRVIINDAYSDIGTTAHPDYGFPLLEQRKGAKDYAWIKFYDGTQTAADAMLVAQYGAHPQRPWTSSAIGTGTAYVVMTFLYSREVFSNLPTVRFELDGIPLYDPRKDTTVGGSGAHRFNDRTTWERTGNPAVIVYNLMRGIEVGPGNFYGGEMAASALPLANWFAGMNACDVAIGSRPSYRAGFEVDTSIEPAQVIEELLKSCVGQVSEYGGVFRLRVGPPAAPVYFMSDEDIVISDPQEFEPFPGLERTYNAISGQYPEPNSLWQGREAPPIYNATWEAEDGDRRLPVEINFPAVPYIAQVEQLMSAYINDQRRFRVHRIVLPPDAAILEPLDTIAWTSVRNGYTTKVFEVMELVDRTDTLLQEMLIRERDPADYNWTPGQDIGQPPNNSGLTDPPPQLVEGFSVTAITLLDGLGLARRPAIRLAWTGTAALDADFVRFEVRLAATQVGVTSGVADSKAGFAVISEGILPSTVYEVRGRYVLDRPTDWSAWLSVTTTNAFVTDADFENGVRGLFQNAGLSAPEIVSSLPTSGNFQGRLVFLTTDNKLYRWTGTAWTAAVPAVDVTGQLTDAQIAAIAAAKLTGQLTDAQIAAIAAAKLTGQITTTQISDNAISTPKVAAGAISTAKIAAGAVTADTIATNAITAVKVQAGAISTAKIAAGAVTADTIATNAITAVKVQAGAISADKIAANTITGDKIVANTITGGLLATAGIITSAAQINDAVVQRAKIAELAVDTIRIAGNAVTVPVSVFLEGPDTLVSGIDAGDPLDDDDWQSLGFTAMVNSSTVTMSVVLLFTARVGYTSGAKITGYRIRAGSALGGGTLIANFGTIGAINDFPSFQFFAEISAGETVFYEFEWFGEDSTVQVDYRVMTALGVRR